jgi:lactoylglutathione lyase
MKNTKMPVALFLLGIVCTVSVPAQKQTAVLNHIAVYVKDLKASTQFYINIVQLDTIPEPFHDGRHTWFSVGPKSHLHLIQGAATISAHDKNNHLCFSVASVDTFIQQLEKHKIEYENWAGEKKAVTKRVDGVKQIYFKDPDGYWLEINDARE